jgi:pantoate--beta-alanine ligase
VLSQALRLAQEMVRRSRQPVSARRLKARLKGLIERQADARLDYVECFHPDTLEPVSRIARGSHLALAVFVGKTRLIDNARL